MPAASGSDEGAAETFGSDAQPAGRSPVQTKNPAGASPAAEMGNAVWASGSDSQPAGEEHARFKNASEGSPAGQVGQSRTSKRFTMLQPTLHLQQVLMQHSKAMAWLPCGWQPSTVRVTVGSEPGFASL